MAFDSLNGVRAIFAEQFEQDGQGITYRKFQKGPAFRVSEVERDHFIRDFDRAYRRGFWAFLIAVMAMVGGMIAFTTSSGSEPSKPLLYAGMGVLSLLYMLFTHRVWAAPARAFVRRTPIAGRRSNDEARRLVLARVGYPQLAVAIFCGLALPFLASRGNDPFSGWNRLWWVAGVALISTALVQAFRKWWFERNLASKSSTNFQQQSSSELSVGSIWRGLAPFIPMILLLSGMVFVAYTDVGAKIAAKPAFWPLVLGAIACWTSFTVVRGLQTGQIEPLARGLNDTYDRSSAPKRYWASVAWNGALSIGLIWAAIASYRSAISAGLERQCYDREDVSSAQQVLSACAALISRHPGESGPYLNRGLMFLDMMRLDEAIRDFTRAHELDPKSAWPLADRGISFAWKNDRSHAERDFRAALAIDPSNPVPVRGAIVLDLLSDHHEEAVDGLNALLKRDPHDHWALWMRADAYQQMGNFDDARADRATLSELNRRQIDR